MTEKLLYFSNAKLLSPKLAKKCRDCSYRENGALTSELSGARKGHVLGKIAVIIDENTQTVLGWGGLFQYGDYQPDIQVYVRQRCRRQGYGTKIVKKLLSKGKKYKRIRVYKSHYDPNNDFYFKNINEPRLHCSE